MRPKYKSEFRNVKLKTWYRTIFKPCLMKLVESSSLEQLKVPKLHVFAYTYRDQAVKLY